MDDDTRAALELALRHGREFTGLRGFRPDPRLFRYVPMQLAARERVVPVVLVGDRLKVASSAPDPDLSLVRERFPRLEVETVLAPAGEVELALAPAEDAP